MKQNSSSRKLNEQAREVLAHILLFEVKRPAPRHGYYHGLRSELRPQHVQRTTPLIRAVMKTPPQASLPLMAAFVRSWDAPCIGE